MAQDLNKDNDFSVVIDNLHEQHKQINVIGEKIRKYNEKVSERCDEISSGTSRAIKKKSDLNKIEST
jgi:hypothetical protein